MTMASCTDEPMPYEGYYDIVKFEETGRYYIDSRKDPFNNPDPFGAKEAIRYINIPTQGGESIIEYEHPASLFSVESVGTDGDDISGAIKYTQLKPNASDHDYIWGFNPSIENLYNINVDASHPQRLRITLPQIEEGKTRHYMVVVGWGYSVPKKKDQGVSNSLPKPFGPFAQRRKYNADNIGILIVRQSDNFDNVDYSFLRPYLYQLTYDKKYYDPAVL